MDNAYHATLDNESLFYRTYSESVVAFGDHFDHFCISSSFQAT